MSKKVLWERRKFDFQSIMMYSFPRQILAKDDPKVKGIKRKAEEPYPVNSKLSRDDKAWVALLYPMQDARGHLDDVEARLR
jgi:hypothetical protein